MRRTPLFVAMLACMAVFRVAAQASPSTGPSGENAPATTLGEVTVSARQRDENLQKVPIAVSVVDGEWLDRSYTVNTQQLSQLVPSLYYNSANPRNTAYTIRGLGSNTLSVSAANDGIEPGVGFYIDGVYHGRPATAAFDFTDIERIEVLRGPQGTLFGKNTTAGAINITSRAPTFQPEGNGEISIGENGFLQARGTVSGPLSETVAGRLSAQFTERDGVLHNVRTGKDVNELNNYALRGQLLFRPDDDVNIRLIGDVSNLDSDCCTQNYLRVGKSLRGAARQFEGLAANLPAHGLPAYSPASRDVYDRLTDIDAPLHIDTQDGGVSLNADWNVGPVTLTSISAWRYWKWDVANDRDYTGIPIQTVQRIPSRQDQYSQEFRVASNGDGPVDFVGGLYFFTQEINGKPISIYGPAATYWLVSTTSFPGMPDNLADGYGQFGDSHFRMKSYAAFGEVNYHVTDRLVATLGARYTYEDKDGRYATTVSGGLPTRPGTAQDNAKLSLFRPQSYRASDSGGNPSGRANLGYQFTDDVLGYVSYAYGYKSGGLNMSGLPLDASNNPALATAVIKDETNKTWETGVKTAWWDGRATLNVAAYRTVVDDYQANVTSSTETAALRTYPANIPEVRVKGVEGDLAALLFRGFTLRASFAYANGKYTDYPAGPCPLEWQNPNAAGGCQPLNPPASLAIKTSNPRGNPRIPGAYVLTGLPLAGLSRWAGSLGFDYELPVGHGAFLAHADVSARSGYNSDTTHSVYTKIAGYTVTNASVGYRFNDNWEVDVFARNLFDRDYITALTVQTGNSGLILGQPSDPRMLGVTLRARF
ncbi:iron complex outermembrane recepter protein [Luteibacter sp. UNC138MFCol5.1]|uniref:TonB-dependent receptor n=1 Tax=Luteibacter sp. UNC138MFCol5.1 TaxID=1502774 RepID=UPI0008D549C7|nr:TonB-dependent receptor [Luteibacter sp. UNC138MFCol5.1]SEO93122.1 iron complex outermembrane recepter protein [Luteibacter sp. UNC138MFCol5.1]